jgi:hypothetical protein
MISTLASTIFSTLCSSCMSTRFPSSSAGTRWVARGTWSVWSRSCETGARTSAAASRVQRSSRAPPPAGERPAHRGHLLSASSLKRVSAPGRGRNSRTCTGATGGRGGCGPGPTSPGWLVARPSPCCASTSSSKTSCLTRLKPGRLTTSPKATHRRQRWRPERPGCPVWVPDSSGVRGTRAGPRPRPPGRPRPAFRPPRRGHARAGSRPGERPTGSRWQGRAGAGRVGGRSRTAPG